MPDEDYDGGLYLTSLPPEIRALTDQERVARIRRFSRQPTKLAELPGLTGSNNKSEMRKPTKKALFLDPEIRRPSALDQLSNEQFTHDSDHGFQQHQFATPENKV